MKATNLGFSPKEMEYIESLHWSLEDVARVYGVPKAMMGDIERITFSNFSTARKVFWEDTLNPPQTRCSARHYGIQDGPFRWRRALR